MKFGTRFHQQPSPSLCVVCSVFNDAVGRYNSDCHFVICLWKMMNWIGCGWKGIWRFPRIFLEKIRKTEGPVRLTDVPADTRTGHLTNSRHKTLLDASCLFLDADLLRVNPIRTLSCNFFKINIYIIAVPSQHWPASCLLPCGAVYWNICPISPVPDTNNVFNLVKLLWLGGGGTLGERDHFGRPRRRRKENN